MATCPGGHCVGGIDMQTPLLPRISPGGHCGGWVGRTGVQTPCSNASPGGHCMAQTPLVSRASPGGHDACCGISESASAMLAVVKKVASAQKVVAPSVLEKVRHR